MRGAFRATKIAGSLVVAAAMILMISALSMMLDGQDPAGIETEEALAGVRLMFGAGVVASIGFVLMGIGLLERDARTGGAGRIMSVLVVGLLGLWILVTVVGGLELSHSRSESTLAEPDGKWTDTGGVLMLVGCCGFVPLTALAVPVIVRLRATNADSDARGDAAVDMS